MIENIEELGPELQLHILAEGEVSCGNEVQVYKARTYDGASPQVSEGGGRRKSEGRSIEPLGGGALGLGQANRDSDDCVGTDKNSACAGPYSGSVTAQVDR